MNKPEGEAEAAGPSAAGGTGSQSVADRDRLVSMGIATPFHNRAIAAGTSAGMPDDREGDQAGPSRPPVNVEKMKRAPRPPKRKHRSEAERKEVRDRKKARSDDANDAAYAHRLSVRQTESLEEDDDEIDPDENVTIATGMQLPRRLYANLFEYQRTGVNWLCELHEQGAGGIIGDEMGLGKTVQLIAFFAALHRSGQWAPSLIVCPATIMGQWVSEFHTWYPPFRVALLHSTGSEYGKGESAKLIDRVAKQGDVLIMTYEGLRTHAAKLFSHEWFYLVLDEGHKIRNPDAEVTLAAKQCPTPHRIILSGTPLQNNLKELWSLFDFVFPGKLGTLPIFQTQFAQPIAVGGYTNASELQVQTAYRCAHALREMISPYLLRRLKIDVGKQLPEKKEEVVFCNLVPMQRAIYKKFLGSSMVADVLSGEVLAFAAITMLRKLCNHPDLMDIKDGSIPADDGFWERCGKLLVLRQLLQGWHSEGARALIFAQTTTVLSLIEKMVKQMGYTYFRMDGNTSIKGRLGLIDDFNRPDGPFVFLLTTKVGGLGVNLTGANKVLLFEPDWNPASDSQAKERAWRLGQQKAVSVYRLITAGTIEEKIYHRQLFKQFLSNKVLKDPTHRRFFKSNDLQDLFTLGDDLEGATETQAMFQASLGQAEAEAAESAPRVGQNLLADLVDNRGMHSVVSHDSIVEVDMAPDEAIMAQEANRVAHQASMVVRESSQQCHQFEVHHPTWTGQSGSAGVLPTNAASAGPAGRGRGRGGASAPRNRFGRARNPAARTSNSIRNFAPAAVAADEPASRPMVLTEASTVTEGPNNSFGAEAAGTNRTRRSPSPAIDTPASSAQAGPTPDPPQLGSASAVAQPQRPGLDMTSAVRMAGAVRNLLIQHGGTAATSIIVGGFKSMATSQAEAIMLKAVLQNVAEFTDGAWTLKAEYR